MVVAEDCLLLVGLLGIFLLMTYGWMDGQGGWFEGWAVGWQRRTVDDVKRDGQDQHGLASSLWWLFGLLQLARVGVQRVLRNKDGWSVPLWAADLGRLEFFMDGIFVITMCLVLVEMKPLMSAEVLNDVEVVRELCGEQSMQYETAMLVTGMDTSAMHGPHDAGADSEHEPGHRRQLMQLLQGAYSGMAAAHHGHRQLLRMLATTDAANNTRTSEHQKHATTEHLRELDCEVQWCRFNESAIHDSEVLSPLCVPDCAVTRDCKQSWRVIDHRAVMALISCSVFLQRPPTTYFHGFCQCIGMHSSVSGDETFNAGSK